MFRYGVSGGTKEADCESKFQLCVEMNDRLL